MRRRNYVLQRMADEGYITKAEADAAKQRPIEVRGQPTPEESIAPFFVEEVRKYLERKYGAKQLYESGLAVHTSLDAELQEAANRALDRGLRRLDKRRGFRKPRRNVLDEGRSARTVPRRALGPPDGRRPGRRPALVVARERSQKSRLQSAG